MPETREIDVGALIENKKLGSFHWLVLALGCLILYVDGMDYTAANVGAPAILRAFHADRSAMTPVFGWGYFGMLLGSALFGVLGDRYGRKLGAILGVLAYSLPALMMPLAGSLQDVTAFRFLAGIGIGGVVPNTIALLTEFSPKRFRVTAVMMAFAGYSLGNATIGQVAARFVPEFGWQVVFVVAGIAGVILSIVLSFTLPESIQFLAATRPEAPKLKRLLKRFAPEAELGENTRIVLKRPVNETQFSLKLLFDGFRRIATPLIWTAFFAESLTYMTFSAWLGVILEETGLPPTRAAFAFSYASASAILAIFILGRFIDRFGPKASVLAAVFAVTAIVTLGTPGLSPTVVSGVAICALACASATHQSLNGFVGGFYPTVIRGNGVGYATGMGRISAIIGPVIVGYLFDAKLPLGLILIVIAAPDLVVAACCYGLSRLRKETAAEIVSAQAAVPSTT
ncbi:MAG TPA: MFS transporter [Micropepsaceae bacterium]|nr:MFS transporter [Micropepsaceae bacterium]